MVNWCVYPGCLYRMAPRCAAGGGEVGVVRQACIAPKPLAVALGTMSCRGSAGPSVRGASARSAVLSRLFLWDAAGSGDAPYFGAGHSGLKQEAGSGCRMPRDSSRPQCGGAAPSGGRPGLWRGAASPPAPRRLRATQLRETSTLRRAIPRRAIPRRQPRAGRTAVAAAPPAAAMATGRLPAPPPGRRRRSIVPLVGARAAPRCRPGRRPRP